MDMTALLLSRIQFAFTITFRAKPLNDSGPLRRLRVNFGTCC